MKRQGQNCRFVYLWLRIALLPSGARCMLFWRLLRWFFCPFGWRRIWVVWCGIFIEPSRHGIGRFFGFFVEVVVLVLLCRKIFGPLSPFALGHVSQRIYEYNTCTCTHLVRHFIISNIGIPTWTNNFQQQARKCVLLRVFWGLVDLSLGFFISSVYPDISTLIINALNLCRENTWTEQTKQTLQHRVHHRPLPKIDSFFSGAKTPPGCRSLARERNCHIVVLGSLLVGARNKYNCSCYLNILPLLYNIITLGLLLVVLDHKFLNIYHPVQFLGGLPGGGLLLVVLGPSAVVSDCVYSNVVECAS